MNIKTNIRAGKGGASGVGQNSKSNSTDSPETEVQVVYVPPVSRCVGL